MKHRINLRKLGRDSAHRLALLRNLVSSLIEHESIETTVAKAKELRRVADKMVTLGKRGDGLSRIRALGFVRGPHLVQKLFRTLAERYRERNGGYTRVMRSRNRRGDNAPMAIVELVDSPKGVIRRPLEHYQRSEQRQSV
ncbi:mitochondrial ribosomal protein L17 precursor [Cyanidioschyzon merolae strain 10D]|jgi:large subunit ribosomal protein L17|uniref:Large ribosomal subunit protein bL17c n=1 Tax=Cyanidioschyzon merolae (strain NIES-3377 / 10D) TaxID=280699 RepID=M1VMQ6_CYAM1|nr:mitochondrial ribosomal protein L17 precursor [Cyanidioschyzon merolae strain 10D]BAM83433.1 mitochondrial ribosomal protein L17 precursor [Cyanidioschyzon merolae strain 10D]|eukprot:XP_005539469.1 mitochondrial ribosomal protein L17 precursor [Cyanidioschyzon merolae strain 10D]